MKKLLQSLTNRLAPLLAIIKKNKVFIIILVVLTVFGFIVFRISYFNGLEPSDSALEEQLKTSSRPKIDKAIVEKLVNLETENIQVQALFNQARENPFSE